ncbi:Golgi-associated plant pathogenesis-related protein 1-like [Bradysia coprophila]|uniref:Golgi-associated plant pathogenesis-related protein 1-like n=1 Tax=Bradysia coprophila TaxID=38358 RepID=UPI00187DC168|nr:Golgi-associated plant pathogenesis-related protein 1-like [Bradysia coprophila]
MRKSFYLLAALCAFISILHTCFTQEAYQTRALNLHNQYRRKHHAPALRLDNGLNSLAVKCAGYYARKRTIDHSCPYKRDAGENLSSGTGGNWNSNQFTDLSCKNWYDEVKLYNYNKPGFSYRTGHFTQIVWKNSQKFGFGYARVNGYYVGVGLYSPPGNYLGQFKANVLRP